MSSVVIERLSKKYGATQVLTGLELALETGARIAVLGPSGIGKTTLLRLIAGLDAPDEGRILIGGNLASRPGYTLEPHRRGIGFVFQSGALWPHMNMAQNVLFGLHGRNKAEARSRLESLVAAAALDGLERRYPDQLSAGQARRAALIRALAPEPQLLLLDEPLTNVEAELHDRLSTLIVSESGRTGATVIHVTHDEPEARLICDRQAVLSSGRLTQR